MMLNRMETYRRRELTVSGSLLVEEESCGVMKRSQWWLSSSHGFAFIITIPFHMTL